MYAMLRPGSRQERRRYALIATRMTSEFVNHREKSALASSWRYELAGKTLEELLDGQVASPQGRQGREALGRPRASFLSGACRTIAIRASVPLGIRVRTHA